MSALGERDDDIFDFTNQVFGEIAKESEQNHEGEQSSQQPVLNRDSEVHTSYLLVNALMTLLLRKGMIYPHEINALVAELHVEYIKKKRGQRE